LIGVNSSNYVLKEIGLAGTNHLIIVIVGIHFILLELIPVIKI
jgi:hypothetical protein